MCRSLLPPLLAMVMTMSCTSSDPAPGTFTNQPQPARSALVEPLPSGVVPPLAGPLERSATLTTGSPAPACESGWMAPPRGSPEWLAPLRVIRERLGVRGEPMVAEMRLFVGPESPPSDKAYIGSIRRWYVKLSFPGEPGAAGRFLVEERGFGTGLVAVAPVGSRGFASPDWVGFQYDPASPERRYPDLPGIWQGIPYDFVSGGEGLTIPGLPEVVAGCLDGT